jgi:hypothetical protein
MCRDSHQARQRKGKACFPIIVSYESSVCSVCVGQVFIREGTGGQWCHGRWRSWGLDGNNGRLMLAGGLLQLNQPYCHVKSIYVYTE